MMEARNQNRPSLVSALEKARQIEIRTRKTVAEQLSGGYRSIFRGQGMDFDEVREYAPGDDVRAIDWNVTARAGIPYIKKFREERELTIILAVDVSASGDFGSGSLSKRERAAEIASVLALAASRSRDKVGLLLYSDRIETYLPPNKGRGHILRAVHEILLAEPQGRGTDLEMALEMIQRVVKRRAAVVVLSDFQHLPKGTALRDRLAVTGHRHDLVAVRIGDALEAELPDLGRIVVEDAETGEVVALDTGRKKVRRAYRERAAAHRSEIRSLLITAGADVFDVDASGDFVPGLIEFFRNRGRA